MKRYSPVFKILKELDLTTEQKNSIKRIMINSKKENNLISSSFTKDSFNKEEFIKNMSEKRENMIKSKADTIEKVYSILDSKQKEEFKVLIDLKASKKNKRFN